MKLDFSLVLPQELYAQLIDDCKRCEISPKQFAGEALESVLASRRLPKITPAAYGAQTRGTRRAVVEHEDQHEHETPADAGLVEHKILL